MPEPLIPVTNMVVPTLHRVAAATLVEARRMSALLKFVVALLLLMGLALAFWYYRRRRDQQMKYAIISMYEDADKPFSAGAGSLESDRLVPDRSASYSSESLELSRDAPSSEPAPPRPPREKRRKEKLLGVDTDDVNAVQLLIKQELADL